MSNNRKLLVASVLKFLKSEIDGKKITPDQEESLNVASQCLGMAFNTKPEDADDLPDLMDLLTKACPDSKKYTVSSFYSVSMSVFRNDGERVFGRRKRKSAKAEERRKPIHEREEIPRGDRQVHRSHQRYRVGCLLLQQGSRLFTGLTCYMSIVDTF